MTNATGLFQLPRGIEVPDLAGVFEAYEEHLDPRGFWTFVINVSAEHISRAFKRLLLECDNNGFWLLEVGHNNCKESCVRSPLKPCHKDVYYLNCVGMSQALEIYERYEELLIHDGSIGFGYCSTDGCNDVHVGSFKIFQIYAREPERYRLALEQLKIEEVPQLKTVWQTATPPKPCQRFVPNGLSKTSCEMISELKAIGLRYAQRSHIEE